jgi:hypothetical protein
MGADGGICWVRVHDRQAFDDLTSWFAWRFLNTSCYAYKGEFAREPTLQPTEGDWIEGGMGTDCEYSLYSLIDMVEWLLGNAPDYFARVGNEDIRDYTFAEIETALLTDPGFDVWGSYQDHRGYDKWWHSLGPIFQVIRDHLRTKVPRGDGYLSQQGTLGQVPDALKNTTLREWGQRLNKTFDTRSYYSEETWT